VLHNSILLSDTYPNPIEYRFLSTTGVMIANNLLDGKIMARNGATGAIRGNINTASAAMFVESGAGNLHLVPTAVGAIDHGIAIDGAPTDWDGQPRPYGPYPDVGADEYVKR
jgi:hypothetical protein